MASIQSVDALQALAAAQMALGDRQLAEESLHQAIEIMKPELNAGMPMLVSLEKDLAKVRVEVENQE